jgi:RNA polymerase primary sigma factor
VRRQKQFIPQRERLIDGFNIWHKAWNDLVQNNLRLVPYVLKPFSYGRVPFLDLLQEGNTGLMRAAEKFDYQKETGFSTYAAWWIRARVHRYITSFTVVSISSGMAEVRRKVLSLQGPDFSSSAASIQEMAFKLGLSEGTVRTALSASLETVELPSEQHRVEGLFECDPMEMHFEEKEASLEDPEAVSPEEAACIAQLIEYVLDDLSTQKPKLQEVMQMRFGLLSGEDRTLSEIGSTMGLSRERIRQLERSALVEFRKKAWVQELLPKQLSPLPEEENDT